MTISRRQVLGALGTTVLATGAGACARDSEQQAAAPAPTSTPAQSPVTAAATAKGEFTLVFGGLQLFTIHQNPKRIVIVMPHAAPGITSHTAQIGIMGGTPQANSGVTSMRSQFGIDTHAAVLDGYRVRISSTGTNLTFDDSPARQVKPGTASDWKSLRHIPDIGLLHPQAKLKPGWDGTLAKSIFEIADGELMALPSPFPAAPGNSVFKGQYYTQMAALRIPTTGNLQLTLDPLPGSKKPRQVIDLTVDSTGPMVGFLGFAPENNKTTDHGKSIEGLFDNLSPGASSMLPMPTHSGTPTFTISQNAVGFVFQPLFNMLTDGSPWCPPFSFRP